MILANYLNTICGMPRTLSRKFYHMDGTSNEAERQSVWGTGVSNQLEVIVGTGNNPAAVTDIALQNRVNLTVVSNTSYNTVSDTIGNGATTTLKNETGSSVTIREIGLMGRRTSDNSYNVLLTRTVLNNPITLANGEQRIFEIIVGN